MVKAQLASNAFFEKKTRKNAEVSKPQTLDKDSLLLLPFPTVSSVLLFYDVRTRIAIFCPKTMRRFFFVRSM